MATGVVDGTVRDRADAGGGEAAPGRSAEALSIGWFLATDELTSASVRYRCHHIARVLAARGHANAVFVEAEEVARAAASLDAVVVVKRIDAAVLEVAATARARGIPLFLDLCDDILSPRYGSNRDGRAAIHFAALAPALTAVTVPSAAMAERVRERAAAFGMREPEIHVIPDIAETREIHDLTADHLGAPRLGPPSPPTPAGETAAPRRILWFGNSGAKHSNFGIFSLLPAMPVLAGLNATVPLELVVVSNSEALFEALTRDSGVPARYVPWSARAVYDELATADVALLTSGDDEFSSIKSLNRTLQALAAGVPVVTLAKEPPPEFEGIVLAGPHLLEKNLRRCLLHDRAVVRRRRVQPARPILARYAPEPIVRLWEGLLARSVARARLREAADSAILFLVQSGLEFGALRGPMEAAVAAGRRCEVLLALPAAGAGGAVRETLVSLSLLPRVYDNPEKLGAANLEGVDVVIVGDPEGAAAKRLRKLVGAAGPRILDAGRLPDDWLSPLLHPPPDGRDAAPSSPGPFPERTEEDGSSDLVFVVHPKSRGWILDAVCREIGSRQPGTWQVVHDAARLPRGRTYFFSHFDLHRVALEHAADLLTGAATLVWYAHLRSETPGRVARLKENFARATRVVFTCEANRRLWLERGLHPARTAVVVGGADPALFPGHARGGGAVGLSSSFYERKNPDLVRDVVRLLPHRRFVLVGRGWREYALFEEMRLSPNFTYFSVPYAEYPAIYRGFDVFLSPSRLEGGPVSLIEAMMENVVPVASRTGFAPDLVRHGENGFLFDVGAPAAEVADLVEKAFALEVDVRATVLPYDWDAFARAILDLAR